MDYLKYNIKILFSPIKWSLCALFIILIPIAFYCPTLLDFLNLSEIYVPFIGIVMLSDIMLIDNYNYVSEILYLTKENKAKVFLLRFLFISVILMLFMLISFSLVYLGFSPHGDIYEEYHLSYLKSYMELLSIVLPGTLFVGSLSMTVANLFSVVQLGYVISLMYWLYWNINMSIPSAFNIFSFSNCHDYIFSKIFLLVVVIGLIMFNSYIVNKSPLKRIQMPLLKKVFRK